MKPLVPIRAGEYRRSQQDPDRRWEHRAVVESITGTPIPDGMVVHHINGDRSDNRPENLMVMTMLEHNRLHHGLNGAWSRNFDACIRCGTDERRHEARGLCLACYKVIRRVELAVQSQSKDGHIWICPNPELVPFFIPSEVDVRGSKNHSARLDESKIVEIRRLGRAGMVQNDIAKRFGVSRSTIGVILNGRTWKHVIDEDIEGES